ncbi:MAG: hypothetical protein B6D79_16525, partial [gamma proteobacterium symbiont of Ctena orbiculata]
RELFLLTASLFALDLLIPDLIPFVDELLLGLLTLLFGSWLLTLSKPRAACPDQPDCFSCESDSFNRMIGRNCTIGISEEAVWRRKF